jgi:hypothetical protein
MLPGESETARNRNPESEPEPESEIQVTIFHTFLSITFFNLPARITDLALSEMIYQLRLP